MGERVGVAVAPRRRRAGAIYAETCVARAISAPTRSRDAGTTIHVAVCASDRAGASRSARALSAAQTTPQYVRRLVLLPCVGFGAAFLLRRLRLWPTRHKLVQLVLLLQLAVPSAQTVLVSLNQLRQIEMGEVLATYYFPMYLASVLTVGFFAALALDFVYF